MNGKHYEDLTGRQFGQLIAIEYMSRTASGSALRRCRCTCGGECIESAKRLKRGNAHDCGCVPKKNAKRGSIADDLTGHRYGKLTVLYRDKTHLGVYWVCRCDCGAETTVSSNNLKNGHVQSCGCTQSMHRHTLDRFTHRLDGTCLEILGRIKSDSNSETDFCGVRRCKSGRYTAVIGFKKRKYWLGTFDSVGEAIEARMDAVELIHNGFKRAYAAWTQRMAESAEGEQPEELVFEIYRTPEGKLSVITNVDEVTGPSIISEK